MNKEEMIRLRWRAITGNLTEEDLNKLNALNIKTTSLENTQEIKLWYVKCHLFSYYIICSRDKFFTYINVFI